MLAPVGQSFADLTLYTLEHERVDLGKDDARDRGRGGEEDVEDLDVVAVLEQEPGLADKLTEEVADRSMVGDQVAAGQEVREGCIGQDELLGASAVGLKVDDVGAGALGSQFLAGAGFFGGGEGGWDAFPCCHLEDIGVFRGMD